MALDSCVLRRGRPSHAWHMHTLQLPFLNAGITHFILQMCRLSVSAPRVRIKNDTLLPYYKVSMTEEHLPATGPSSAMLPAVPFCFLARNATGCTTDCGGRAYMSRLPDNHA
jgi:hypothetical protein